MPNKQLTRLAALSGVALASTLGGSAIVARAAQAAQYNFTKYSGGPAEAVGTSFSMATASLEFTNSDGTSIYAECAAGTLSGVTDAIVSAGPSAGLSITGGALSRCSESGTPLTYTLSFTDGWQVTPVSGLTSPFDVEVTNIKITQTCGSATATFTGTLSGFDSSTAQEKNVTGSQSGGSQLVLADAGSLTKSGTGCAAIPSTEYVTSTFTLTRVGGNPVSATNNLWENYD